MIDGLLTKQEFIVMDLLWKADEPLSLHEILEIEPGINRNTLQSVIRRLMQRNLIQVAGYGFNKTSLTRKVASTISQYDYFKPFLQDVSKRRIVLDFIKSTADTSFLKECRQAIEQRLSQLES